MKRLADFLGAMVGLVVLSPVMALAAIAVRTTSRGPALFRQERVGLGGRPFDVYKFRTMRHVQASGPLVTASNDPRLTPVGRVLRRTKMDELPQLLNVLKGDMSLVGPRPEVRKYVDLWPTSARSVILSVKPGITDPTALAYLDEERLLAEQSDPDAYYATVVVPAKVRGYVQYVEQASLSSDLRVMARTLSHVLRGSAR